MIKFCYNPFTKQFLDGGQNDHAATLYNAGQQKNYDLFIRGILFEGVLYLRVFYPFPIDEGMSVDKLKSSSLGLLQAEIEAIKNRVSIFSKIVYNADNETFKRLGINYI